MAFFNSAITVLQTLVVALGAGLGIWGAINLLEGRWTVSGKVSVSMKNSPACDIMAEELGITILKL